jgi:uncharacterized Zn-finger protein
MKKNNTFQSLAVSTEELPLHCPTPAQESWNLHPKVFLLFDDKNQSKCPYCGTQYQLTN